MKKYGMNLFGVGIALSGVAIEVFFFNHFVIRFSGVLVCLIGVYLSKISNSHGRMALPLARKNGAGKVGMRWAWRLAWVLGVTSLAATSVGLWYMNIDSMNGYDRSWPVYSFFVGGSILGLMLSCIFAIFIWKTLSR